MKNIILGGLGFIGRNVAEQLRNKGQTVIVVDQHEDADIACDLAKVDLTKIFEGSDVVYNFAGALGTSELESQILPAFQANTMLPIAVFEAARAAGVKQVFYPSKPNVWLNVYSISKKATEMAMEWYNAKSRLNICSLRYFNIYGPGQKLLPIRKIIPTFAAFALQKLPIEIFGSGLQTVDMLYVLDAAKLAIELVERGDNITVDCGRGVPLTVIEIAELVNQYLDNPSGITFLPMREGEDLDTKLVANLETFVAEFDFSPWQQTLFETLDYYRQLPNEVIEKAVVHYRRP